MPRYRGASVRLKNGRLWRKPGRTILDEIRLHRAKLREEGMAEEQEAKRALDNLRAEVELAKVRREARAARKSG